MTRPRVAGRTMTSWAPTSFRPIFLGDNVKRFILAFFCITAAVGPALGQSQTTTQIQNAQKGSLADLIQAGNRKTALDRIRTGAADVNEAQPDGTRPIHWAVYRVDYELIDALIARKAKVDVT